MNYPLMFQNYCSIIIYKMSKLDLFILTDNNDIRRLMFKSLINIDYNIKSFTLSDHDSLGKLSEQHKAAKYIMLYENIFDFAKQVLAVPEYYNIFKALITHINITNIYICDVDEILFNFDREIIKIHNFFNLPSPGTVEKNKLSNIKSDQLFINLKYRKTESASEVIEKKLKNDVIIEYDRFIELINKEINEIDNEFSFSVPLFSTEWKKDYEEEDDEEEEEDEVNEAKNNITISIKNLTEPVGEKKQEKVSNRFPKRRSSHMRMQTYNR